MRKIYRTWWTTHTYIRFFLIASLTWNAWVQSIEYTFNQKVGFLPIPPLFIVRLRSKFILYKLVRRHVIIIFFYNSKSSFFRSRILFFSSVISLQIFTHISTCLNGVSMKTWIFGKIYGIIAILGIHHPLLTFIKNRLL